MKLVIVELFNNITQEFRDIEAIADTGASKTTLAAHISKQFGIPIPDFRISGGKMKGGREVFRR